MKLAFLLLIVPLFSDMEITSTLSAHHQRDEQVVVDSGKWNIEVFTSADASDLTCTFSHLGQVVLKQEHTRHCFATTDLVLPAYITVNVANNENHEITYKVRSYSVMKTK